MAEQVITRKNRPYMTTIINKGYKNTFRGTPEIVFPSTMTDRYENRTLTIDWHADGRFMTVDGFCVTAMDDGVIETIYAPFYQHLDPDHLVTAISRNEGMWSANFPAGMFGISHGVVMLLNGEDARYYGVEATQMTAHGEMVEGFVAITEKAYAAAMQVMGITPRINRLSASIPATLNTGDFSVNLERARKRETMGRIYRENDGAMFDHLMLEEGTQRKDLATATKMSHLYGTIYEDPTF